MDVPPLIIVEGFLGGSGAWLWGDFASHLNAGVSHPRKALFASVGPVSSLHDRACELYYAIKGGRVDYGQDHSECHHHLRYGRCIEHGLYPNWSTLQPLHFLGHSMGGSTIVKMQDLMKKGHFGSEAHPDMVLSVNTISAPFRGSQIVYALGERTDAAPAVNPWSLGALLTKSVHIVSYLSPILPSFLDLHIESRQLSFRDSTFLSLLQQLWKSDWAESIDATPFDVTFQAAEERETMNGEGQTNPRTYYQSLTATMADSTDGAPSFMILSPFYPTFKLISNFDFSVLRPVPSFLNQNTSNTSLPAKEGDVEPGLVSPTSLGPEYLDNDGVVPLVSQWHPRNCSPSHCNHHLNRQLIPGVWQVRRIRGSHTSVVPFWIGSHLQKEYWQDLGQWLRSIDSQRTGEV